MRSWLFVPSDNEKKLAKGRQSAADALILDLEDSVAPARRSDARRLAARVLAGPRSDRQPLYVRINPLAGEDALLDLAAVMPAGPDGIVLPKATPAGVQTLDHYLAALEVANGLARGATRICAIATETPAATFELGGYPGASPRLIGLTWGAEDLAALLGATNRRPDGGYDEPFVLVRSLCLLGAHAAGVMAIDGVFTDYKDTAGLAAECHAARRAGFAAKLAIHPDQLPIINQAFAATAEERRWAKRVVDAFAANPEAGTVGVDGTMIDRPHLILAQRLLAGPQGTAE